LRKRHEMKSVGKRSKKKGANETSDTGGDAF